MIKYDPLIQLLEYRGIANSQLSDAGGFSSVTLSKLKKGESMTLDTIDRICQELKVPIERVVKILDESGESFEGDNLFEEEKLFEIIGELRNDLKDLADKNNDLLEKNRALRQERDTLNLDLEKTRVANRERVSARKHEYDPQKLGERFMIRKEAMGYTNNDIVELSGLTKPTVDSVAYGKSGNPTTKVLIAICTVLDCSVDWLLFGDEE